MLAKCWQLLIEKRKLKQWPQKRNKIGLHDSDIFRTSRLLCKHLKLRAMFAAGVELTQESPELYLYEQHNRVLAEAASTLSQPGIL